MVVFSRNIYSKWFGDKWYLVIFSGKSDKW
jgi:hypothetical protein